MFGTHVAETAMSAEDLLKEIRPLPRVFGLDTFGTVHIAPNTVYRVVRPAGEPVLHTIMAHGILERLVQSGLIETEVRHLSQFPAQPPSILEHRRVRFVTAPAEWSPTMLLEAARLLCTFSLDLDDHGLMLRDGHALNVTFERGRPVFLDFGSLMAQDKAAQASWLEQFRSRVMVPLWFAGRGGKELVRQMLKTEPRGLSWYLARTRVGRRLPFGFGPVRRTWQRQGWRPALSALLEMLDTVRIPAAPDPRPTRYDELSAVNSRHQDIVLENFRGRRPESVLHLGGGAAGVGEAIATQVGVPACSTDVHIDDIERAHQRTKSLQLPLDVAVLDIMYPTAPYGAGARRPGAVERLRAESVLVLSLLHQIVIKGRVSLDAFAQAISDYTTRSAVVAFVDPSDAQVRAWAAKGARVPSDYTPEGFAQAFLQYFSACRALSEQPDTRRLYEFTR